MLNLTTDPQRVACDFEGGRPHKGFSARLPSVAPGLAELIEKMQAQAMIGTPLGPMGPHHGTHSILLTTVLWAC